MVFDGKAVGLLLNTAHQREHGRISGDADLRKKVDDTVEKIIVSQTADGCISSYPAEKQTDGWDIWGRKYVLLALMRYYEVLNSDPAVLKACCGIMEHFMSQIGPGKKEITACGWHDGLAASSILGAVVNLWRLTGLDKYRDFIYRKYFPVCSFRHRSCGTG